MADDFEAPAEETTEPSLRDSLAEAFVADAAPEGVQPPATIPEPGETQAQADERARDALGRFAKPDDAVQKQPEPNAQQAGEEPAGAIRPPASWSAAAKADFAKLPQHIQSEVLKREADIEAGNAQWQSKGERLNRLDAILAPRREKFALAGIDEAQAMQALFAAQDMLERQPYDAILFLARQYGVDLSRFGGSPQQQAPQAPMPPVHPAVLQEVQQLRSQLTALQQAPIQAEHARAESTAHAFLNDPAHPYAWNVKDDMAALLATGRVETLDEAYERAVWSSPETRQLMQAEVDKTAQAQQQQKAQAARYASGSVTGSPAPGSGPAGGPAPTLREELDRAYAAAAS